ncbi:FkbH-like protein [Pandoraea apista]|uniref:HAD-IIIC family phosphatase n=1 Tax=Pandoraea apista TaxID=93218 RepID=UPI000CE943B8|nr:HAD-IIIC family phosphatase [Pandoraea apista]AVF38691.1 FkbH-like protein [Pandoraea apista]
MHIEYVGNITTQPFGRITKLFDEGRVVVSHHNIDQVMQVLLGSCKADALISHLTEDYFLNGGDAHAIGLMEQYSAAIQKFANGNRVVVVVNTLPLPIHRLVGVDHIARQRLIMQLNQMLFACAEECSWVSIADTAGILARCGHDASISPINDAVMRSPYTNAVIPHLLEEYARILRERFQPRKKVLLLDADNTLWGGVVGEDGVNGIQVGDQYPGILYRRFQDALAALRSSGLLLCLVTKNNERDVQEAFEQLNMPLRWEDFAAIRANWSPKSSNIESIAKQLNVGIDSMVFIDDNPVEIAEVAARLPMLTSRQFSVREAANALAWLEKLPNISVWSPSAEDLAKSEQYRQEAERQKLATSATSIADYIRSLDMVIEVGVNRANHVKRITQLTNKTNQFNLTTRRYTETEILNAMDVGQVFDFRVRDRFGDMGIIGVVVVRNNEIETFLMSCRAMGRNVEDDILKYVLNQFTHRPLIATYIPTAKNPMVANFYDSHGFSCTLESESKRSYEYIDTIKHELTNNVIEVS